MVFGAAFADDLTLEATTAQGLQTLINVCAAWAYKYGMFWNVAPNKTAIFTPDRTLTWVMPTHKYAEDGTVALATEPIPNVDSYRHLGIHKTAVVSSHARRYDHHVGKHLAQVAQKIVHDMYTSGLIHLPITLGARAFTTLQRPALLYACEVWGPVAPTKAFSLLEERVKQVARMLLQVGVTTLPKPVLHIVSGVAPLRQSVVQAVMQRWITTATLPQDSPARAALKAELDEWCSDPKSLQHASLWIHAALKILSEVDVAYAWWTSRQWSPTDPWKDVNVGATEVKSWRAGMVALLMGLDPAGKRWTDSKQQGALLTTLRKWYRHAALVLTIYNYWSEIEELKSLDDVKDLLQGNNPAPYSVLHRSPANDARSRMRGGIRGLLGYEERYKHLNKTVFETGQPPRRQCPLCKQPLSVPHLIRDCVALEVERRKTGPRRQCRSDAQ